MRLSRVFVDLPLSEDTRLILPKSRAHYVKNVLRIRPGQNFIVFNGDSNLDFSAELQLDGKHVIARILSSIEKQCDPAINISLVQAIGRSEHNDFVVQKATELGVSKLIFFNSERTQSPIKANRLDKKMAHWTGIAISACEQCNRNRIPRISFYPDLASSLEQISDCNRLLLDFNGSPLKKMNKSFIAGKPFHILVGAEGGLSENEIQFAHANKFDSYSLGPRTLRMETAAISIVTLLQHYFGDLP